MARTSGVTRRSPSGGQRFTHVYLENWRNFTRVEVALQARVFLVGPNAAGKSNLLDVFRFLRDIVAVGGGFQAAVRKRGGVSRLRSLAARRYPEVVVRVSVGRDTAEEAWKYELRLTQDNQRRPMVSRELVVSDGKVLLDRPNKQDEQDRERLTQTFLEQVNVNRDYRELVDFFGSVRYLHVVPQLVREPDRSVGRRDDPFGGDFLEQIARTSERTQKSRLVRITEALRVAVPQLRELELVRDDRGTPHLRGRYEHWRPQGAWHGEDQFSDGTLRLLGLLWSVLDGSGPLLLEEPELSLHPGVVQFLPQVLASVQRRSGRQIAMSTHSPDILRDPGIALDEVVILSPGSEGASARIARDVHQIVDLLGAGISLDEAVLPETRPGDLSQLALFKG